jgi:hypothetical protein
MAKKRRKAEEKLAAGLSSYTPPAPYETPGTVLSFLERHALLIAIFAVLLASVRIAATYTAFSETSDEPAHVACGMEWVDKGRYTCEVQHPPLARVAVAIGPYLLGGRSQWNAESEFSKITAEGLRILRTGHRHDLFLSMARLGVLPFFWIGCWVVWEWGRRYFNRAVAALAVAIFSFIPTVLAHAGLATTDMALTAFLGAAFLTLLMWVEQPTLQRGALFGLCSGLAIASKFSALVFFPAAAGVALVWYLVAARPSMADCWSLARARAGTLAIAALVCFVTVWAFYRFSFGKVYFANISLPAPEFYAGIHSVSAHNAKGHPSYLLGHIGQTGWWYFFPVLLLFKTPFGVLLLVAAWLWMAARKDLRFEKAWLPMVFAAAVLGVGMTSRIDLGLRHVLPVYMGMALMAAVAVHRMAERARERRWLAGAAAVLCGWLAISSLLAHPDYLPYFNLLAGSHPEDIVADSDLDWGQDVKRLAHRLHELGTSDVMVVSGFATNFEELGIHLKNPKQLDVLHPPPGYSAVSISDWKVQRLGLYERYPDAQLWPDVYPATERIGKGMLLWYNPTQ